MAGASSPDWANAWRDALRDWETQTNAAMNRVSGTEQFSQTMNGALGAMLRAQASYGEAVEQALVRMNLPNRADIRALSSKLDDIERRLEVMSLQMQAGGAQPEPPAAIATPPRTRRAPRPPGEGGA